MAAWLSGPETPSLHRVLPEGTRLLDCFPVPDGELTLDLGVDKELRFAGGAAEESLAVAALARTILENIDSVAKVRILINGREQPTLAGHLELDRTWNRAEIADLLPIQDP